MAKPYYETLLDSLIRRGHIWKEGASYVCRASDGVICHIGTVGEEAAMATYLYSHQTPDTW